MFNYHSKGVKDLHNSLNIISLLAPFKVMFGHLFQINKEEWEYFQEQVLLMILTKNTRNLYKNCVRRLSRDNQIGLLVMIPGKYIGIDLFTNKAIFKHYKERLYSSHLIELLEKYEIFEIFEMVEEISENRLILSCSNLCIRKVHAKKLGKSTVYTKELHRFLNLLSFE